jgi:large subunit ribosomal protein L24e
MPNCSFCDGPIKKGTGVIYSKKDGTLFYFCSSKCKKNTLKLKREGRRQNWTNAGRKFKEGNKSEKQNPKKK